MHTLQKLEQAVATAKRVGLGIRYEYLGGVTGGICEIAGKKWVFVDLSLSIEEQLDQVKRSLSFIAEESGQAKAA